MDDTNNTNANNVTSNNVTTDLDQLAQVTDQMKAEADKAELELKMYENYLDAQNSND